MKPFYMIVPESVIAKASNSIMAADHDAALRLAMDKAQEKDETIIVVTSVDRVVPDHIVYLKEIECVLPEDIIPDMPDPLQVMFPGENLGELVAGDLTRGELYEILMAADFEYHAESKTWSKRF